MRYADAGVQLDVADAVTERITSRLGSALFGGMVAVPELRAYTNPVLVSSMDGVGTKVRLAARLGDCSHLGQDLVHHCVNDIAVHGATPLFFLDYLAFHTLIPHVVHEVVEGIAGACEALGMRLAGGETAEMPGVYAPDQFDVAGAIVGVAERDEIVDGSQTAGGDILLGLPASGLHTNGYSLVQRVFADDEYQAFVPALGQTLGSALLTPHRCYLPEIRRLFHAGGVRGFAHITGGGIAGNLARIIPDGLTAEVSLPTPPPLYRLLHDHGIPWDELHAVFNMGIGLIAVCAPGIAAPGDWIPLGSLRRAVHETGKVSVYDHPATDLR
jgi:phosphoribosylformylglycinamidine cyclo-ligase